jgi:hypothetical protein
MGELKLPGIAVAQLVGYASFIDQDLCGALSDLKEGRIDDILTKRIERAIDFTRVIQKLKDASEEDEEDGQ